MSYQRYMVACALSALSIGIATPAFAQQTAPSTATPAPTAAADEKRDDDIVVTAQGRSQLLGNVPAAVSAVTAQSLANSGANDIRQLTQLAPSLLVSSTGSEATRLAPYPRHRHGR